MQKKRRTYLAEMLAEVYRALRSVGIDEDRVQAAASALTALKDETWKRQVEIRLERIDGTLRSHAGILGTNTAMLTAVLFKVFTT